MQGHNYGSLNWERGTQKRCISGFVALMISLGINVVQSA